MVEARPVTVDVVIKLKTNIDVEVMWDSERGRWIVRPFGGDLRRVYAVETRRRTAVRVGKALARVYGNINLDGSCELYVRKRNGQLSERNTYGRDPRKSKG